MCYLRDGDAALFGELLLGLLAGIRVRQVRVEVLVQHLRGLLAEVASLAPGTSELRSYVNILPKRSQLIGLSSSRNESANIYKRKHGHCTQNTLAPGVQEAGAEDHDRLASALFKLRLDGAELAVDDGHHALDLARRHRPRTRLLAQQVHDVGGELAACLEHVREKPVNKQTCT